LVLVADFLISKEIQKPNRRADQRSAIRQIDHKQWLDSPTKFRYLRRAPYSTNYRQ
jgi:hypothetical protein